MAARGEHLFSELPDVQVELAVDIYSLGRLPAGRARHQEVVRQPLLPLQARLIRRTLTMESGTACWHPRVHRRMAICALQ
jgi:hypothetical protein